MPQTFIVQYVPDAVTNERINIGVVVVANGTANSLFLSHWNRVKQFAGANIAFLKDIQRDARRWDEATVLRLASQWTGSVQLTEPRFTTLEPEQALFDASRRYLLDRSPEKQAYRGKSDAVRIVKGQIREKLVARLGTSGQALLKDSSYELKGKHLAYGFDVTVGNGRPFYAAQGISFEVPDTRHLDKEITSTAWLIEDVKRETPDLPLGVSVLPPKATLAARNGRDPDRLYDDATRLLNGLGARVLTESDLPDWAAEMADKLPPEYYKRPR